MLRKHLAVALVISVFCAANLAAHPTGSAETVKQKVMRLGVGEEARVIVKLQNQLKVKGYVSEVGDESFVVVKKSKDGTEVRTILYRDVIVIYKQGVPVAKAAIWIGVVALGVLTVIVVAYASDNS